MTGIKRGFKFLGIGVAFGLVQFGAAQFGAHMANRKMLSQGYCRINLVWNTPKMCREKGVTGDVWSNYDGTYRPN